MAKEKGNNRFTDSLSSEETVNQIDNDNIVLKILKDEFPDDIFYTKDSLTPESKHVQALESFKTVQKTLPPADRNTQNILDVSTEKDEYSNENSTKNEAYTLKHDTQKDYSSDDNQLPISVNSNLEFSKHYRKSWPDRFETSASLSCAHDGSCYKVGRCTINSSTASSLSKHDKVTPSPPTKKVASTKIILPANCFIKTEIDNEKSKKVDHCVHCGNIDGFCHEKKYSNYCLKAIYTYYSGLTDELDDEHIKSLYQRAYNDVRRADIEIRFGYFIGNWLDVPQCMVQGSMQWSLHIGESENYQKKIKKHIMKGKKKYCDAKNGRMA